MKAYGYIRVSGVGQINGDGFTRQEKSIKDHARNNGIEVVKIFKEEGVSGTICNRPALAQLLVALEQNGEGIESVIIERLDRLARDLMVQETIIDSMRKIGVKLLSATDGDDLLTEDPTRTLVRRVLGSIAEYDKQMTVQKLRVARERKRARDGKCEGRKSYSELAPELMAEIKRLRRKPKGGKRLSLAKTVSSLNDSGFTSATGKPFTVTILKNIIYRTTAK